VTREITQQDFNDLVMDAIKNGEDILIRHPWEGVIILVVGRCDDCNEFMSARIDTSFTTDE